MKKAVLTSAFVLGMCGALLLKSSMHSQSVIGQAVPGPVVFTQQLQTVKPGEAIQLNGSGFTSHTRAKLWRVTSPRSQDSPRSEWIGSQSPEMPDKPSGSSINLAVINASDDVLHLALPASAAKPGVYAVYTSNDGVNWSSAPFVFNHPQVYFLNYQTAGPGREVKAFGKNLQINGKSGYVYLYQDGGTPIVCSIDRATENEVSFTIPIGTPDGTYQVWVHNGFAGNYGFDHSASLTVAAQKTAMKPVYNVTLPPFLADGTGKVDAASAIQAAIDAVSLDPRGGIVYFPAGTYKISDSLSYTSSLGDVTFRGDGKNASLLQFRSDAGFRQEAMFSLRPTEHDVNTNKTVVEDLGFDTSYQVANAIDLFGRSYVTVDDVRIKADNWPSNVDLANGAVGISFGYNKETTIAHSEIYANDGIAVAGAIDLRIYGNHIYSVFPRQNKEPDNDGIRLYGVKRAAVYDNVLDKDMLQDRAGTRYYYGRGIHVGGNRVYSELFGEHNAAYNEEIYIGFNSINRAGKPGANDGEIIVADGASIPGGGKVLPVASAEADRLATNQPTGWVAASNGEDELRGAYVYIVGGLGVGQVRKITDFTASSVTVAPNWDVIPDSTSKFIVTLTHARQIYANNTAIGNQKYIGIYGEGFLNTIANNVIDAGSYDGKLGAGITFYPYVATDAHIKYPVFYNEARGNLINKGMIYMPDEVYAGKNLTMDYPIARGNVIAGNKVTNFPQAVSIGGSNRPTAVWNVHNLIMNNVAGAGVKTEVVISPLSDRTLLINQTRVLNKGTRTIAKSVGTVKQP